MVNYIHSIHDGKSGEDLGRLYMTRTLKNIHEVTGENKKRVLIQCLEDGTTVVVPELGRRCMHVSDVVNALDVMGVSVLSVDAYVQQLNIEKTRTAVPAPAAQERRAAVR